MLPVTVWPAMRSGGRLGRRGWVRRRLGLGATGEHQRRRDGEQAEGGGQGARREMAHVGRKPGGCGRVPPSSYRKGHRMGKSTLSSSCAVESSSTMPSWGVKLTCSPRPTAVT